MRAPIALNFLLLQHWMAGKPGYGEGPVAPNVSEFRKKRSAIRLSLRFLNAAVFFAIIGSGFTLIIGMMVITQPDGPPAAGASTSVFAVIGLVSASCQLIALWIAVEFLDALDAPGPVALEPSPPEESKDYPVLVVGLLMALLAGAVGFFVFFRASMLRLHPGPAPTEYGPSPDILAQAAVLGAAGFAFNVVVAAWLRSSLNPLLKPDQRRAWGPFMGSVVAGSALAIALTFYGIFELRGDNPAGLAGAISIVSLFLLVPIVQQASDNVSERPEPAPNWPPMAPVMAPVPAPPGMQPPLVMAPPVQTVPPGAAPVPPPTPQAPPPPVPPPGYVAVPAAVQVGPYPLPLAAPPARCPRCNSPRLAYAQPPARGVLCHQCGYAAPY